MLRRFSYFAFVFLFAAATAHARDLSPLADLLYRLYLSKHIEVETENPFEWEDDWWKAAGTPEQWRAAWSELQQKYPQEVQAAMARGIDARRAYKTQDAGIAAELWKTADRPRTDQGTILQRSWQEYRASKKAVGMAPLRPQDLERLAKETTTKNAATQAFSLDQQTREKLKKSAEVSVGVLSPEAQALLAQDAQAPVNVKAWDYLNSDIMGAEHLWKNFPELDLSHRRNRNALANQEHYNPNDDKSSEIEFKVWKRGALEKLDTALLEQRLAAVQNYLRAKAQTLPPGSKLRIFAGMGDTQPIAELKPENFKWLGERLYAKRPDESWLPVVVQAGPDLFILTNSPLPTLRRRLAPEVGEHEQRSHRFEIQQSVADELQKLRERLEKLKYNKDTAKLDQSIASLAGSFPKLSADFSAKAPLFKEIPGPPGLPLTELTWGRMHGSLQYWDRTASPWDPTYKKNDHFTPELGDFKAGQRVPRGWRQRLRGAAATALLVSAPIIVPHWDDIQRSSLYQSVVQWSEQQALRAGEKLQIWGDSFAKWAGEKTQGVREWSGGVADWTGEKWNQVFPQKEFTPEELEKLRSLGEGDPKKGLQALQDYQNEKLRDLSDKQIEQLKAVYQELSDRAAQQDRDSKVMYEWARKTINNRPKDASYDDILNKLDKAYDQANESEKQQIKSAARSHGPFYWRDAMERHFEKKERSSRAERSGIVEQVLKNPRISGRQGSNLKNAEDLPSARNKGGGAEDDESDPILWEVSGAKHAATKRYIDGTLADIARQRALPLKKYPRGQADYIFHTGRDAWHQVDDDKLVLPRASNNLPTKIEIEVQGHSGRVEIGAENVFLTETGALYLKLFEHLKGKKLKAYVHYDSNLLFEDKPLQHPAIDQIPTARLAAANDGLGRIGATRLEHWLAREAPKPVTGVKQLETGFKEQGTLYNTHAGEGEDSSKQGLERSAPFVIDDFLCYQCDGAALTFKSYLDEVFKDSKPKVTVDRIPVYVYSGKPIRDGHVLVRIRIEGEKGYLLLDPTPIQVGNPAAEKMEAAERAKKAQEQKAHDERLAHALAVLRDEALKAQMPPTPPDTKPTAPPEPTQPNSKDKPGPSPWFHVLSVLSDMGISMHLAPRQYGERSPNPEEGELALRILGIYDPEDKIRVQRELVEAEAKRSAQALLEQEQADRDAAKKREAEVQEQLAREAARLAEEARLAELERVKNKLPAPPPELLELVEFRNDLRTLLEGRAHRTHAGTPSFLALELATAAVEYLGNGGDRVALEARLSRVLKKPVVLNSPEELKTAVRAARAELQRMVREHKANRPSKQFLAEHSDILADHYDDTLERIERVPMPQCAEGLESLGRRYELPAGWNR